MDNVISIDVEQWFHRPVLREYIRQETFEDSQIIPSIRKILELFRRHNKRTTFFVLGEVAENVPSLIEEIIDEGHEIAYHGYSHITLNKLGQMEFESDIVRGSSVLRHITRESPKGFRSPLFSLNKETAWALKILKNYGFQYDSSILPALTLLYGSMNSPDTPYFPSIENPTIPGDGNLLLEFPILTRKISYLKLPAGGGFFLRLFGLDFIIKAMKKMNKRGYPAMCYLHPWEINGFPKVNLPLVKRIYAYHRIPCYKELEYLVRSSNIKPAIEIIESNYGGR